jgi:uncharacterized membrane protein YGL010W
MFVWSSIYLLKDKILIISIISFVLGWIIQFIEHLTEGKRPLFFEDIKYLLIGPLYVFTGIFIKFSGKW